MSRVPIVWFALRADDRLQSAVDCLRESGFNTRVFLEGDGLLDELRREMPDVIVTRLIHRHMMGGDVFKVVKENATTPRPRIILITTLGASGEPIRYWPELFDAYVFDECPYWQLVLQVEEAASEMGILPAYKHAT